MTSRDPYMRDMYFTHRAVLYSGALILRDTVAVAGNLHHALRMQSS